MWFIRLIRLIIKLIIGVMMLPGLIFLGVREAIRDKKFAKEYQKAMRPTFNAHLYREIVNYIDLKEGGKMKTEKEIKNLFSQIVFALSWDMRQVIKQEKCLEDLEYLLGVSDAFSWILGYQSESKLRHGILMVSALKERAEEGKVSMTTKENLKNITEKIRKEMQAQRQWRK